MALKHLFLISLACFLGLQALAEPEGAFSEVLPSETRMRNELSQHYRQASQEMAAFRQSLVAKGLSEEKDAIFRKRVNPVPDRK